MAGGIFNAIVMIFYYIAVVGVGIWAGRRVRGDPMQMNPHSSIAQRRSQQETKPPEDSLVRLFVANRKVSLALVVASMTATWFGGGYLNCTAETVFNRGLLWAQAPVGYALSLLFGGMLFAGRMRVTKSLTMLDPFQQRYGPWVAVPLVVPAVCGEVSRTAAMLSALGDSGEVIAQFHATLFIVASTCITALYTALGSLFSVLYTDVLQMVTTLVGLFTCLPNIVTNEASGQIGEPNSNWVGKIEARDVSQVIDQLLTTTFGGIPWQVYFQRVLSCDSVFSAKLMSYLSAVGCIVLAIAPAAIGAASKSTNFTATGYSGPFNLLKTERKNVLSYAMRYMSPGVLSFIGLLAITGAVMSSVDSCLLSAATLITRNIYHFVMRPLASDLELELVLRFVIFGVAILAICVTFSVESAFDLWLLSSDFAYVLLFPQFVGLFYLRESCNAYGAILALAVGLGSRVLCGDPVIGLPVLIKLPLYDDKRGQQFPYRTFCMLLSMLGLLTGSALAAYAFRTGRIPRSLDVCRCFFDSPFGGGSDGKVGSDSKVEPTTVASSDVVSPSSNPTSPASPTGETGEVAAGGGEEHNIDGPTISPTTTPSAPGARESNSAKRKRSKSSRADARPIASGAPSGLVEAVQRRNEDAKKARSKKKLTG